MQNTAAGEKSKNGELGGKMKERKTEENYNKKTGKRP